MKLVIFFLNIFLAILLTAGEKDNGFAQEVVLIKQENPFGYDLDVQYSKGTNPTILLLSHGFGSNSQAILNDVRPYTQDTLIAFNYIDHDFSHATGDDNKTSIATPLEIMPLIYMLKKCIVDLHLQSISLYGYALGASNIIYAIDYLMNKSRDELSKKYNITDQDKILILEAIRKGKILLDVPFKHIDEIIALRGPTPILLMYKERAAKNGILAPLDTLKKLKNLDMTFLLFFDINNEEFSNRDDSLFVKSLFDANPKGTNIIISTDNGGHAANHPTLWKIYNSLK